MKLTSSRLLVATGILHQIVGLLGGLGVGEMFGGRNIIRELASAGVLDAVARDPAHMAWLWFTVTGFAVMIVGSLGRRLELRGERLPASLGWQLGALAVAGIVLIPMSGFWLLLPQAWSIVRRALR